MTTPPIDTGFPSLVLRLQQDKPVDRAGLEDALGQVNALLFERLGVITPRIDVRSDLHESQPGTLELDGRVIGTVELGDATNSAADLLAQEAAHLVVPALIDFYLCKLQARMPALTAAVRARFPLPELAEVLGTEVSRGRSIKNFGGILNEMIVASTSGRG